MNVRALWLLLFTVSFAAADTSPRSKTIDPRKFSLIREIKGPSTSNISPAGNFIATYSGNTIQLFDVRRGEKVHDLEGHAAGIHDGYFSDNGRIFASTGNDGKVKVWDTSTGEELHSIDAHTGYC